MGKDIFVQIVKLIEKKMGRYKKEITRGTSLERDLGISGEDAWELLLEYKEEFGVDISKFDFNKYFSPEGDTVLSFLFGRTQDARGLTIGDLEKGIIAKRLDEDVIRE
jgi:acyl carrier protein